MNNTLPVIFAIILFTLVGLHGTIGVKTISAKIFGFVGMFLAIPVLFALIAITIFVDEHTHNGWFTIMVFLVSIGAFLACVGTMVWIQDKLDA